MSKEAWVLVGIALGAIFTLVNTHFADRRTTARELRAARHLAYANVLAAAFEYVAVSARVFQNTSSKELRAEQNAVFLKVVPTFEAARLLCDTQRVQDAVVALLNACTRYGDNARGNHREISNTEYQDARERFTQAARAELGRVTLGNIPKVILKDTRPT